MLTGSNNQFRKKIGFFSEFLDQIEQVLCCEQDVFRENTNFNLSPNSIWRLFLQLGQVIYRIYQRRSNKSLVKTWFSIHSCYPILFFYVCERQLNLSIFIHKNLVKTQISTYYTLHFNDFLFFICRSANKQNLSMTLPFNLFVPLANRNLMSNVRPTLECCLLKNSCIFAKTSWALNVNMNRN